MGIEREGEPYEHRVRQWLGADPSAFDILFIEETKKSPVQFAYWATRTAKGTWEQMDQWCAHVERLKVKNFVRGLLLIQPRESERNAFTVRRQKGEGTGALEVEWQRGWETTWAAPSSRERVWASRPRASGGVELHVVHVPRQGQLAPSQFTLKTSYPFAGEDECPSWVATLVARCDGKTSTLAHFEEGKRQKWLPAEMPGDQFVSAVGELVGRGILEIEEFLWPRHTNPQDH